MKLKIDKKEILTFEVTNNEAVKLHAILGKYIEIIGPNDQSGLHMIARNVRNTIGKLLKVETPMLKIRI